MFEEVLVGVDGGAGGRDAIALAGRLLGRGGRMTLAHVSTGTVAAQRDDSLALLREERANAGVEAELESVLAPNPGRGLHEQAERAGADLLVVGSCSRATLGRAMLGDDTRTALNGAPCAVGIAAAGYATHTEPIATVGVGYNGSLESDAALAAALELAARTGARVQALDVVSISTYAFTGVVPAAIGDGLDAMLAQASERLRSLPAVEGRAVCGHTGEELAVFGDEVDLLVVGSRGYGPLRRLMLGSTSNFLQRHARCSLLVLPRGAGGA